MSRHDYKNYDDDTLIREIVSGEKTYSQIGQETGLTCTQVSRIALGNSRPELQQRLEAAREGFLEQARRLGARLVPVAVKRLAALIASEGGVPADVQRQAAVDIIHLTVGDLRGPTEEARLADPALLDMVVVQCKDGAIALPEEMFVLPREKWEEGPGLGLSRYFTRADYLRFITSRKEKGTPEVHSRPEDHKTLVAIHRDRGETYMDDMKDEGPIQRTTQPGPNGETPADS